MSFRFKLENGVKERRQWSASIIIEAFFIVMQLSDLVAKTFERHISGKSRPQLPSTTSNFWVLHRGLGRGGRGAGVVSWKKSSEIRTFICNSKPI